MQFYRNSTALALIILVFMGVLMLTSIREDSITTDEAPHITSGYSYLKLQDFRLNPEHPPLIKDLAAIPLLFLNLNFPKDHPAWTSMVNAQWDLAPQFLYRSGNDPDKIIFWGRILPILITLLFGWFVFKWARELYGAKWALFALTLFAFSPTILAHGRLVTTDVPAAAAFFVSIYYFIKLLKNPSKKNLIIAGVVFAIAQLTKFSLVLLIGFLPALTFLWISIHRSDLCSYTGLTCVLISTET
jgi:predicted membrane-bound dolichyl-phosphate-mannose-protein mannosyltransferase